MLEILVCPICRERVVPDEAWEFLRCDRCKLRYSIRNDVPNMLIDHAVRD